MRVNRIRKYSLKSRMWYPTGSHWRFNRKKADIMTRELIKLYPKQEIQLAVMGSSGAMLASYIASSIGDRCYIIYIRKSNETSHDCRYPTIGDYPIVILDDFIESGTTINTIYEEVQENYVGVDTVYDTICDTVCVSGRFKLNKLNFKPKNVISG